MGGRSILVAISCALVGAILGGCHRNAGKPPRAHDAIQVEPVPSTIAIPVEAKLSDLTRLLERQLPRRLWRIDRPDQTCVRSRKVDIGIATLKTPAVKCRIVGTVTRGALSLSGSGHRIRVDIPLDVVVSARNVAGVLQETANATAMAHATIDVTLARDWSPRGTVRLAYDWTDTPHVDILGQRIDFAEEADRKLAPVVARLERSLTGELGKLGVRQAVEGAWAAAFATISLNAADPSVWMRITPRALQYGGYAIADGRLRLRLGVRALTETHIGRQPQPPRPTPLPPLEAVALPSGALSFFVPVFADYRVLEPVLLKALRKRERQPFDVPGWEPVRAHFEHVEVFGTTGGRIAVGLTFVAAEQGVGQGKRSRGTIWMTGKPVTVAGSRRVRFDDFAVSGSTDMEDGKLALEVANAPGVAPMIATMLTQDFERDYLDLLNKIDRAIDARRQGSLMIRADVREVRTGQLQAAGAGLYLPVWAEGTASIRIAAD